MFKMTRFPPFGKRFFRLARKLLGSCHFQHFWRLVTAIASLRGRRSIQNLKKLFHRERTRQAIAFFLNHTHFNAPEVLRQTALDRLHEMGYQPGHTVYLLLDDTQKQKRGRKMAAVTKIFLHAEKIYAQGHTILGAALSYRGVVIPVAVKLWANEEFCRQSQKQADEQDHVEFRKLTELAADIIGSSVVPPTAKTIVLFDSYYLCPTVTTACEQQGYRYVGGAKKNRSFFPDGRGHDKRKLSSYGKNALHKDGRVVKVNGQNYRLTQRVGRLSKLGRVKLVFSRRVRESSWVALATNETRWSVKTVLSHYRFRWGIEVFFKMSKQYLGLGDYQVLRYRGIERYLCLVLIAHLLLTHLAVKQAGAKAKRTDQTLLELPSVPGQQQILREKLWKDSLSKLQQSKKHKTFVKKINDIVVL